MEHNIQELLTVIKDMTHVIIISHGWKRRKKKGEREVGRKERKRGRERERKEKKEKYLRQQWPSLSTINDRYKTTDLGNSDNTKQEKHQNS